MEGADLVNRKRTVRSESDSGVVLFRHFEDQIAVGNW
jgi:hypothetical protein